MFEGHARASSPQEPLMVELRRCEPPLRALARRLCRNEADADDLVQDTVTRALEAKSQWTVGTDARAWLCRILHNLFIDRCRKRSRHRVVALAPSDPSDVESAPLSPVGEPRWARLTEQDLRRAVQSLSPKFREVYELHSFQQASYEVIAARLGISPATVGSRLSRARRKLRGILSKEEHHG